MIVGRWLFLEVHAETSGHLTGIEEFLKTHVGEHLRDGMPWATGYSGVGRILQTVRCRRIRTEQLKPNIDRWELIRRTAPEIDREVEILAAQISALFCTRVEIFCSNQHSFFTLFEREEAPFDDIGDPYRLTSNLVNNRPLDPVVAFAQIRARPEAARMLAAALSANSPSSSLAAYVRVLEAAFDLNHNPLRKPLHHFLASGGLGFTRAESDRWIDIRHGVSHGTSKTSLAYDSDALAHLERIKLAAYDVVMNKVVWGDSSSARADRNLLATTVGLDNSIATTQGAYMSIGLLNADYFNRFPVRQYRGFDLLEVMQQFERRLLNDSCVAFLYDFGFHMREEIVARAQG